MGLLTWMGKMQMADLLNPVEIRCHQRIRESPQLTYTRDCGHAMHGQCYSRYLATLSQKETTHEHFEGQFVILPANGEITCP